MTMKTTITMQEAEDKIRDFLDHIDVDGLAELTDHIFGVECWPSDDCLSFSIKPIEGQYCGAFDLDEE